jgi:hypothetical protein
MHEGDEIRQAWWYGGGEDILRWLDLALALDRDLLFFAVVFAENKTEWRTAVVGGGRRVEYG